MMKGAEKDKDSVKEKHDTAKRIGCGLMFN